MCIICNMAEQEAMEKAFDFLGNFEQAGRLMRLAEEQMLELSSLPPDPEVRKQYDLTHKRMVRLRKEWNAIEHFRELATPRHASKAEG